MDFDKNTNHTLIIIFYFKKKKVALMGTNKCKTMVG